MDITIPPGETGAQCPWLPPLDPPGGDLRPDPDKITTPAQLVWALGAYRAWAGNVSFRTLAGRCDHRVGASTFQGMLKRDALPRLELAREFLLACGVYPGYLKQFVHAWHRVAADAGRAPRLPDAADRRLGDVLRPLVRDNDFHDGGDGLPWLDGPAEGALVDPGVSP